MTVVVNTSYACNVCGDELREGGSGCFGCKWLDGEVGLVVSASEWGDCHIHLCKRCIEKIHHLYCDIGTQARRDSASKS